MRLAGVLVVLVLALAGCGGGGKSSAEKAKMPCMSEHEPPSTAGEIIDPSKRYRVELRTNKGSFTIELAMETSPHVTSNFLILAHAGFFNGTCFHRIVPGFVIQGGDPTGTGTGGPGPLYSTVDKPPADTKYTKGIVAMAKTATDPPGTAGSQFFVVTAPDAGLPPDYAILGNVVEGIDVVDEIGKLGDANEQPTERVEIEATTVTPD